MFFSVPKAFASLLLVFEQHNKLWSFYPALQLVSLSESYFLSYAFKLGELARTALCAPYFVIHQLRST